MSDHLSSSDEDMEEILQLVRIPKAHRYYEDTVPQFSDKEYIEHFRLSKLITEDLAQRFAASQYYNPQEGGSEKVTPLKYMTVFLWYAANEATSFRTVADRFAISKSTLNKIIKRVLYFLSNLAPEVIRWPNNIEREDILNHFVNGNFPGVIGVVDGTHIRIDKPADDPDSYINRKHFYSIQAQIVCDHKRRIRDIYVGYPGSVHDSRVLRSSPLFESLEEKCGDQFIIGDSGYPCLRHLLTPFRDNGHLTRRQRNYNYLLSKNRYVIEHCFGILKQKFRQLYHLKLHNIEDIVHFIRACAVLHNLSLDNEQEVVNLDRLQPNENHEIDDRPDDDRDGTQIRVDVMNSLPLVV